MPPVPPHNFSWVEPDLLAGMALPRLPAHYEYLYQNGIRHLVTLTEHKPPYHDTCPGITFHRIRIQDFCPPSLEQIKTFLKIVEDARAKKEVGANHCIRYIDDTCTLETHLHWAHVAPLYLLLAKLGSNRLSPNCSTSLK
ncbi:hypothetical protein GDO78_015791, partial [Eleutherodactylus coqui]